MIRHHLGNEHRAQFAASLGISKDSLALYERGETVPTVAVLAAYRMRYRVNANWLAVGEGEMFDVASSKKTAFANGDDFGLIPAYRGPGEGAERKAGDETVPSHQMALNRGWLNRLGVNPDYAILAYADGDSMWPTIADRAPMVIDTSNQEVRHGLIYAFSLEGNLVVKRINRCIGGRIELISDNREKYPPQIIDRDQLDGMQVVGRVYLAIQQL